MAMNLNTRITSVPLSNIQKTFSDHTLSSSRFNRGFTGCGDISEEEVGPISCNNFENLISTTPFRGSRSSLGSTSCSNEGNKQNIQPEVENTKTSNKTSAREKSVKHHQNVHGSQGRRSLALRKKSHFSRYGRQGLNSSEI